MPTLPVLLKQIRACRECEAHLPEGPRPVLQAGVGARILIVGQAPGRRVHQSGIPWEDPSGDRLREWTRISRDRFYDPSFVALVPMGFCYPGTGASGDLPPRPECVRLWHERLLAELSSIQLTLLVGQYAQRFRLGRLRGRSLTETVRNWREYAPATFPLPHPSPRNNRWLKKNPWFSEQLLPELRHCVQRLF